jgi:hypothetical protein
LNLEWSNQLPQLTTTRSQQQDTLKWLSAINGICTTKAAYTYLASQQQHILPQQGSRNLSPHAHAILLKVWKSKLMPHFLKTFAWRLFKRALSSAERAAKFSIHIQSSCMSSHGD